MLSRGPRSRTPGPVSRVVRIVPCEIGSVDARSTHVVAGTYPQKLRTVPRDDSHEKSPCPLCVVARRYVVDQMSHVVWRCAHRAM